MDYTITPLSEGRRFVVVLSGIVRYEDLSEAWIDLNGEISKHCESGTGYDVLIDLGRGETDMGMLEVGRLRSLEKKNPRPAGILREAIIARSPLSFGLTRAYQTFSKTESQAYKCVSDATAWLDSKIGEDG